MYTTKKQFIAAGVTAIASFGLALTAFAQTWVAPTGTPPNNNVAAPINVSTAAQTKSGALGVTGFANFGEAQLLGFTHVGYPASSSSNSSNNNSSSSQNSSQVIYAPSAPSPLSFLGSLFAGIFDTQKALAVPNVSTPISYDPVPPGPTLPAGNPGTVSLSGGGSAPATITNFLFQEDGPAVFYGSTVFANSAKVGVGTAAPDSRLHIHSAYTNAGLTISTGSSNWMQVYQPYNQGQLRIGQGSFANNSVSNIATFTADGKVGVGTTNPGTKIDAVGGQEPIYARMSDGGGYTFMGYNDSGSYGRIGAFNNGWKNLVLAEGGKVGVGTTNPSQKLDVNGAAIVHSDGYPGTNGILYLGDGANYIRSVQQGGLHLSAYNNVDGVVLQENGVTKINKLTVGSGLVPVYWHKCSIVLPTLNNFSYSYVSTDSGTNNNTCPGHQGGQSPVGWLIPNQ